MRYIHVMSLVSNVGEVESTEEENSCQNTHTYQDPISRDRLHAEENSKETRLEN